MQLKITSGKKFETDALILPLYKGDMVVPAFLNQTDKKLIARLIKEKEFRGEKGELALDLSAGTVGKLMLVGLGDENTLTLAALYKAVGGAVLRLKKSRSQEMTIWLPRKLIQEFDAQALGQTLAEAAVISGYTYTKYKTKDKTAQSSLKKFVIHLDFADSEKDVSKGAKIGQVIATSTNITRDYGNSPSNEATPTYLANAAQEIAKEFAEIKLTILHKKQIQAHKMGGLLGVAQGSNEEPKFIVMEYWGADRKKKPYVVVGKGITFDTGGISIKPSQRMQEMKIDMAGGAAVLGIMRTIAALKLPLNLVGLLPTAENMPSGTAYKPGDILTMMDGSTVEVLNTDAEGRLILADALTYAQRYKPEAAIDIATLTGACEVALGELSGGLFTKDKQLCDLLLHASTHTGDLLWQMPLFDEYLEHMRSPIADIRNIGHTPYGGAIQAGIFLQSFVKPSSEKDGFRWAHLDIAGTAFTANGNSFMEPGATGAGVRLMVQFLRELVNKKD